MPTSKENNGAKGSEQAIAKHKKAEEKLELSYNTLTELLESIQEIFYVLDRSWNFVYVNKKMADLSDMKPEDIVGQNIWKLFPKNAGTVLEKNFRIAMETRKIKRFETGGKYTNIWYVITVVPSSEGIAVMGTDIAERKKAEATLRESEEKFRQAFAIGPDGFSISKLKESTLIDVNERFLEMFGYTRQEVVGKSALELGLWANPSDREKIALQLRSRGKVRNLEIVCKRKNGETFPILISVSLLQANNQQLVLSSVRDFSSYRKAEETLQSKERELASIYASVPEVLFFLSVEPESSFRFLSVSQSFLSTTGLQENQVVGKSVLEVIPEPSLSLVLEKYVQAIRERKTVKWEEVTDYPSGRKHGEVAVTPFFDSTGRCTNLIGSVYDITERKKAEEALKSSEEKANDLIKYAPSGIYELDYRIPPKFRSVNDSMCQILGYTREELLATNPFALLDDESKMRFRERIMKMLAGEKVDETVEFKVISKDGREIYAIMNTTFTYKDGKPDGALVIAHDVTERKKAEMELEKRTKNLETLVEERTKKLEVSSLYSRNLIEASLDPLVTINTEGKITDVNKATEQVTGRSRFELIGTNFSNYFIEPEKAELGYKRVFTEGLVRDYPLAIRHKNGTVTDVLYNSTVFQNENGDIQGVFAAARDITALRKAEEEAQESAKKLKDAERLATIGATAGMVGHDIRNPLQAITSDLYLLKSELDSMQEGEEKDLVKESLDGIEKNVDYINKIVADLQDFAKPLNPHIEEADLKLIVEDLLRKNGLPENVKVSIKIEGEARKVTADSTFISRIMYNLITNAVQAMPDGGKLTIHAYKEANDLIIAVKDTGVGIPDKVKNKLFTPMFTTKSKGQGFGLAVIKRMTESLGGAVSFESQENRGTTFTIRLPPPKK